MTADTKHDVDQLLAAGRIVREAFERMKAAAVPGVTTAELDAIAAQVFEARGARSAPQAMYDFPGATCISVNDEATQADTLGLRTGRNTYTSNLFAATADYFLPTTALRAYYRLTTFSGLGGNSTNAAGLNATTVYETNVLSLGYEYLNSKGTGSDTDQNIDSQQLVASLGRPFNNLLFAGVSAAYNYTTESQSLGGNFQIATVSVFGRYLIPGKWLLNGNIGISQLFADSQPNRTSPAGSGTLSYLFPDGVASIGFNTGFANTFALGQNFGVIQTSGMSGCGKGEPPL
jgi:hypothetical protein